MHKIIRQGAYRKVQSTVLEIRRYKRMTSDASVRNEVDFSALKKEKYERRLEVDITKFNRRFKLAQQYRNSVNAIDYAKIRGMSVPEERPSEPELGAETGRDLRYAHAIENTIGGITYEILTTVIVELSVRRALLKDIPDSRMLLEGASVDLKLSSEELRALVDQLSDDGSFTSLPYFRTVYNYFKTNDWLSYTDSEFGRSAKGATTGYSQRYESDDLIPQINCAFDEFESIQAADQLAKVDLMVKVVGVLNDKTAPVSTKTLRVVLQRLNGANMFTYEQIILKYLVPLRARSSLLSADFDRVSQSSLIVHYFQTLIEQDPELLMVLFNFYDKQGNRDAIKQLFSYMKFDEVLELERIYHQSVYDQLLSKSRFLRSRKITDLTMVNYNTSSPVKVSKASVYNIIDKCIKYEMFEYVDFMVNKIIFQSIDSGEVLLSFSAREEDDEFNFVIDNDNINEIVETIFDDELIMLMLKVIEKSNDFGRLMWLIPNLDIVFQNFKHRDNLNLKLVQEVFKCLSKYGVDGKLISYEKMLGM